MKKLLLFHLKYHVICVINTWKRKQKKKPYRLQKVKVKTVYPTSNYHLLSLGKKYEMIGENLLNHKIICK